MIDKKHYEQVVKESTPGKFEGENPETAYYYEMAMNGGGESFCFSNGEIFTVFEPTAEEREIFFLGYDNCRYFTIWTDDNGFIYGRPESESGYKILCEEYEKDILAESI